MRVLAGIVLYNADINRLQKNINSISSQVDEVLLVNNGSSNFSFNKLNDSTVNMISNKKNMGIAFALNQILDYALEHSYNWFITLDQDSIVNHGLIERYKSVISDKVGQITCRIIDANKTEIDENVNNGIITEVPCCITSGCLNNAKAIKECGGYRTEFFIDGVDLDISFKLIKQGYKILKINYIGVNHELGNPIDKRILFWRIKIANHIPWRNYYTRRNMIIVARENYTGTLRIKEILRQVFYGIGTVFLEDQKVLRIKENCKGIWDGITTKGSLSK